MIYYLILTGVLWTFVAAVALANRGQLSRHPPGEHREESRAEVQTHPRITVRRRRWQRIVLLSVLGYEGAGALLGGSLLVAAPDGHLMDMPVDIMHGFFSDFLIPGLILIGLGILNTIAFVAVWRQSWIDWLLAGLAVGGLAVWFIVEIAILRELHWLHAMWGLPVLAGCFVALPLVPSRQATRHGS